MLMQQCDIFEAGDGHVPQAAATMKWLMVAVKSGSRHFASVNARKLHFVVGCLVLDNGV